MAVIVTVEGVKRGVFPGFSLQETANGRNTFMCDVPSLDGTIRDAIDDEIIVEENDVRLFGGLVRTSDETSLSDGPGDDIVTTLDCVDFNSFVDRRYITLDVAAGTLKAALTSLVPFFSSYGVTLDPSQVDGPSLPAFSWRRAKAKDVFTELATLSNYLWEINYSKVLSMFPVGSRTAPFNIVEGGGFTVGRMHVSSSREAAGVVYANRVTVVAGTEEVPIIAVADDEDEQADHGLWEIAIRAPTVFDATVAQALADAYLLQRTPTPKTVVFMTTKPGLHPGQVLTINFPRHNVNNTFIVSEVSIQDNEGTRLHTVTALEGAVFQPGWRNLYQQWLSPLTQVTVIPGTGPYGRSVHFLGGNATTWVQSTSTDPSTGWVPVDGTPSDPGMQVTIDTVTRGTTSAMVTVRLRAMSGGVSARLRNVSDNIVVGSTSAPIESTTFQSVTFAVTLTNGSKIYRLELLPTVANVDIAGIGILE